MFPFISDDAHKFHQLAWSTTTPAVAWRDVLDLYQATCWRELVDPVEELAELAERDVPALIAVLLRTFHGWDAYDILDAGALACFAELAPWGHLERVPLHLQPAVAHIDGLDRGCVADKLAASFAASTDVGAALVPLDEWVALDIPGVDDAIAWRTDLDWEATRTLLDRGCLERLRAVWMLGLFAEQHRKLAMWAAQGSMEWRRLAVRLYPPLGRAYVNASEPELREEVAAVATLEVAMTLLGDEDAAVRWTARDRAEDLVLGNLS